MEDYKKINYYKGKLYREHYELYVSIDIYCALEKTFQEKGYICDINNFICVYVKGDKLYKVYRID